MNVVYFDLETQKSAEEVGGWGNARAMLMSVGVTYSTERGGYKIYGPNQARELILELRRADLVVGYNIAGFDYEVLGGLDPFFDPEQLRTLDLLVEIHKQVKRFISLDSFATATMGVEKTSEGLQAIRWFREGKMLEIAEYCCYDVKITKMLHDYGVEHGQVFYLDRFNKKLAVPVAWAPKPA